MDARRTLQDKTISDLPVALHEGEVVIGQAIISNGIYWKSIAVLIIAVLLLLFVAHQLAILFFVVAAVTFLYEYIIKHALLLILTNQRVFVRAGVIKVDTVQLRYDRIESVEIQRTIPGQLLNYATLMISGTGTTLAFVPYMANAKRIRDKLDEMLYKREEKPTHVIVDEIKR